MEQEVKRGGVLSKKYYLNDATVLLLPLFFITLSIFDFLQTVPEFSVRDSIQERGTWGAVQWLATGFSVMFALLGGVLWGVKSYKKKETNEINAKKQNFIITDYKVKPIQRGKKIEEIQYFLKDAFHNNQYVFLIGQSGDGKSLLFSELLDLYKKQNVVCHKIGVDNYANSMGLKAEIEKNVKEFKDGNSEKCYLIFDQFESAFRDPDNFSVVVELLKEFANTNVYAVFICRKDKFIDVFEELQSKESEGSEERNDIFDKGNTLFLSISKEEKAFILEQLKKHLSVYVKGEKQKSAFDFLERLFSRNVSMIEINIVRTFFVDDENKLMVDDKDTDEYVEKNLMGIVQNTFGGIFESLKDPQIGMVIVYSLCCRENLSITDFKNLTFALPETIKSTLEELKRQEIIRPVVENIDGGTPPYAMTHDYLRKNLKEYCQDNLSEKIISNVDFYCKNTKKEDADLSMYYQNSDSNLAITCLLGVLCLGVFLIYVKQIVGGYVPLWVCNLEYEWSYWTLGLTVLAVGSAIFYIYHYLQRFARIFFTKCPSWEFFWCTLIVLLGMVGSVLALLVNEFWVSWLALVWLAVAGLHCNLSGKFKSNENIKSKFMGEFVLYLIVAFGLIGLNFWVTKTIGSSAGMYPWFGVLILFVFGTIRQHLNTDWVLSKLNSFARF